MVSQSRRQEPAFKVHIKFAFHSLLRETTCRILFNQVGVDVVDFFKSLQCN